MIGSDSGMQNCNFIDFNIVVACVVYSVLFALNKSYSYNKSSLNVPVLAWYLIKFDQTTWLAPVWKSTLSPVYTVHVSTMYIYVVFVFILNKCQNLVFLFSELKRNTDDIQVLRNKIMEVLRKEPYMGEKIPVR